MNAEERRRNSDVCKKCAEVFSRVQKVFDTLYRQMFGMSADGSSYCPRSKEEAQRVLAMSAEICSCLHSLVSLSPRPVEAGELESIAQIVAKPVAYSFCYVDEVMYARFPRLVPEKLKEGGRYVPAYSLHEAVVKREDMDELRGLVKEASEKCCQACDSLRTRMREW